MFFDEKICEVVNVFYQNRKELGEMLLDAFYERMIEGKYYLNPKESNKLQTEKLIGFFVKSNNLYNQAVDKLQDDIRTRDILEKDAFKTIAKIKFKDYKEINNENW
jgi:hypothetical protein